MGLYDRDYGRDEATTPWDRVEKPRSITIVLIVINCAIWLLDSVTSTRAPGGVSVSVLAPWLATDAQTLIHPWMWWQCLTYGFVHDTQGIRHILFNMIGLFFFGRAVEQRLGNNEFLRFYLIAIVIGGIVGSLTHLISGSIAGIPIGQILGYTVGASGAVIATTILFACYYPHSEILLMFVFPIKAWIVAVFFVVANLAGAFGFTSGMGSNTAFTVHLSGAFFALGYFYLGWRLRWIDLGMLASLPDRMRQRSRRMKLKLHDPDKKLQNEASEADRILAKIHESGESSLTTSERRTLERYSRRQREKRKQ